MDTTPATTTTSERPRRGGAGRWLSSLLAIGIALPLLWFGAPRFAAALQESRYADAVALVERGGSLPREQLQAAVEGLELALRIEPSRDIHVGLALLHQAGAKAAEDPEEAHNERLQAIDQYRSGLALAPMEPLIWSRLAWLLALDGRAEEALEPLRFSTTLAAYAPEQMLWRLELWFRLFEQLSEEDRGLLRRQVELAFDFDPERTARLAEHYGLFYWVRYELDQAGVEEELLDEHFPVKPSLPRRRD